MGTRSLTEEGFCWAAASGCEHSRGLKSDLRVTGQVRRHVTYELTQGCAQKGLALGLMPCCHHPNVLFFFMFILLIFL